GPPGPPPPLLTAHLRKDGARESAAAAPALEFLAGVKMRVGGGLQARENASLSWPSTEDTAGDIEACRLTLGRADHRRTDGCVSNFGVTSRSGGEAPASASRCPAKIPLPSPS
ncbi:unnamed protein product, partial [Ectocarpus sp. 8 AP-2014]